MTSCTGEMWTISKVWARTALEKHLMGISEYVDEFLKVLHARTSHPKLFPAHASARHGVEVAGHGERNFTTLRPKSAIHPCHRSSASTLHSRLYGTGNECRARSTIMTSGLVCQRTTHPVCVWSSLAAWISTAAGILAALTMTTKCLTTSRHQVEMVPSNSCALLISDAVLREWMVKKQLTTIPDRLNYIPRNALHLLLAVHLRTPTDTTPDIMMIYVEEPFT